MNASVKFQIGTAQVQLPQQDVLRALAESMGVAANGVPKIGEYWPGQGGVNGGLMRGVNGVPDYYVIVPTDKSASFKAQYGAAGKDEPGATCDFDGLKNTRALIESSHEHPAAERCASLVIEGHSDLYLPARRELALCYANVPELFEKSWHLSSTQYSASLAWSQLFDDGDQGNLHKLSEFAVRPVRRFSPSSI